MDANQKSNIDNELEIIKNAGKGEDVRDAIRNAILKIYNFREYPPTTKKFTQNTGPEGETGGPWDRVIVNVTGSTGSVVIDDMSEPITDNGYYTIETLKELGYIPNEKCDAINGFRVNVKQTPGNFGVINITENGTYDPLLDGYDGYSKVYVNVLSSEHKDFYTVKFYDYDKTFLGSVQVPYGANATYPKNPPSSGGTFTGWNPNPISVSRDMNCYAVYAGKGATGSGSLVETISDTWKTIATKVKAGNRPYDEGSTKLLTLTGYNGATYILNMMLIGYNLDINQNGGYASSTWMNINNNGVVMRNATNHILSPGFTTIPNPTAVNQVAAVGTTVWWGNSLVRALYNRDPSGIIYKNNPGSDDLSYYKAMLSMGLTLPDAINNAAGYDLFSDMVWVNKYSDWKQITKIEGQTSSYNMYDLVDQPTIDKIWLPNYKEMLYPYQYPVSVSNQYIESRGQSGMYYGNPGVFSRTHYNLGYGTAYGWVTRDIASNRLYPNATAQSPAIYVRPGNADTNIFVPAGSANNGIGISNPLPIGFCL